MASRPMALRYLADVRTLALAAVLPVVVAAQYARPALIPWLLPLSCYLAMAAGVVEHNHNHCPTFTDKRLNGALAIWLSLFFGYPSFAWIATHNLNHHRYVNNPGDITRTWRFGNRNTLLRAVTYFFVSSYYQNGPIAEFIRNARRNNPRMYRRIVLQYALWLGPHAAILAGGIALWGPRGGLTRWAGALLAPAVFSVWALQFVSFVQHAHADPWSERNHSRNFTGPVFNLLMFNNGFHTAHHEQPGAHWSTLPALHRTLADQVDPALSPRSFSGWLVRSYLLGAVLPRFATHQIGREPSDAPAGFGVPAQLELPAVEEGTNRDREAVASVAPAGEPATSGSERVTG